jgi:hypothetical protein
MHIYAELTEVVSSFFKTFSCLVVENSKTQRFAFFYALDFHISVDPASH